ncbi:MAG: HEPN domain-containing protein [Armatimonadota bacterium]
MKGDLEQIVADAHESVRAAEALLAAEGERRSKHSAVIAAFGRDYAATDVLPRELHKWLRNAFDKRMVGDYSYTEAVTEQEAAELIEHAREFVAAIEGHLRARDS